VRLRNISPDDLWLYEATVCDPVMMAELGGPRPREGLEEKVRADAEGAEADRHWVLGIVPDGEPDTLAGSISVWDHEWNGETITEMGWMVLPRFQGRGLATEAARAVLDLARITERWSVIHAFPAVTNVPSNAICRKAGFELVGPVEYEYKGNVLRTNHWRLDLSGTP